MVTLTSNKRPRAWVCGLAALSALVLGACGGDGTGNDSAPPAETSTVDAGESADTADTDDAQSDVTGPARGTVQIDGQSFDLSPSDNEGAPPACVLADRSATVMNMVSDEGHNLSFSGSGIWSGELTDPAIGANWEVASHDPLAGVDASVEFSVGRLVVTGTWAMADGRTAEISAEVICPEEIKYQS